VNRPGLISSPGSHENQPKTTIADCFAGAERNLDLVRHWREALFGWRDQMVYRRRAGRQTPEAWRLLARGSVGEILRLKPTLVVGSVPYKQETVGKLLEQPFPFLAMNPRTLADIETDIRLLGGLRNERMLPKHW